MRPKERFLREYQAQVLDGLNLPPGLREQYEPVSCLKDGERQVLLVRDRAGWPAVLKVQPAGREDTLRLEYDLLRSLRHSQLPGPLAYLEADEREYLVREYVEGVSLYEQVAACGPLSPAEARAAAMSLCRVLEYLHGQSPPVICRDVKPQNVILDGAGTCHLVDLGTARRYRPEQAGDTVFLGTEATAPPEQFGYRQTDRRSDVYGVGMLLRFLLTGSFDTQASLPCGAGLRRVIRRCTAFDPKDRYPAARSVRRALKYCRLTPVRTAAAVVCAALLLAALWWYPGSLTEAADAAGNPADQALPAQSAGETGSESRTGASLLEDALRQELGLDADEPIPPERLGEVEQLLVCGQTLVGTLREHEELVPSAHDFYTVQTVHGGIGDEDMALLRECTNLRVLILDYQQISDLTPLAGLPLEYLSLTGNQISDLTPLAECRNLQVLDLGENPVRSVRVLEDLPSLREVTLEATGITSVEVFAGSGIQSLNVRTTWVRDFSPLEECPSLTRLIVGDLPGGAADTLAGLTGLEELRLYSTTDVDLSGFAGLQKLQDLDLYGCTLVHPEALARLSSLCLLNLGGTGTRDLSFLPELPSLRELDLRNDPLSDLTALLDCPWLTLLTLSDQHQSLAQGQLAQAAFRIQYQ